MDLKNLVPGQRDWVNTLNDDLTKLNVKSETADIVTLNGWTKDATNSNALSGVRKYYLLDGTRLIVCQLAIKKTGVVANEDADLCSIPDGFTSGLNYLPSVPVDYNGHEGGYLRLFFIGDKIHYHFTPLNGGVDGEAMKPQDLNVYTSLVWIN